MNTEYDVITVGGATEDITFYVDDYYLIDKDHSAAGNRLLAFDYGTKVHVNRSYVTFGGGASNTAVCFASLGIKVAGLISCGSDNRGKRIISNLSKAGVDVSLMKKITGEMSGFSFIVIGAENEHVAFSNRAANEKLNISAKDIEKLKMGKWIFVTSFSGSWKKDLNMVFSLPEENKIAWNPGERQLEAGFKELKDYLSRVDVLTFNKDEAVSLMLTHPKHKNESYDFLSDSKNLLEVVHSWGPKIVVITNNEHGADVYDGNKFYHQPIVEKKVKEDTTGLGDAFGSSFIAGLNIYDNDIKSALYLAANNAASVLGQQGAQNGLMKAKDIKGLIVK